MKNEHLPYWNILWTDHLPQTIFPVLVAFWTSLKPSIHKHRTTRVNYSPVVTIVFYSFEAGFAHLKDKK